MIKTKLNCKNSAQEISKYFSVGEVTKNDPRRIPITGGDIENNVLQLAIELEKIREEWGYPIVVMSLYRPPEINRTVGGSTNKSISLDIYGRSVDLQPINPASLFEFQAWLDQHWYGALGYAAKEGFVYLDMRNGKGWRSGGQKGPRWNY